MATTLAIIFISFFVAGATLYGFLVEYAVSQKEKTLKHYADRIIGMEQYLIRNNTLINREIFKLNVEGYGQDSSSVIFIVDNSGEIIQVSLPSLNYLVGKKIDSQLIQGVSEGKEVKLKGNFSNLFNKTYLILGYPIKYNERVVGSVFLNTPIPELQRLSSEVYGLFLKAIGISALIAVFAIYLMSRRISHPLGEMGKVAKQIANGDFDSRVKIRSKDEIGELAKTFNYMAEKLGDLEKMRKNFIANISHELRTPMTSIIGFIEGIIDGTIPSEKQSYYLSVVKDETVRLTKLVNDLLDLAKIESGEVPLSTKVFNINELIKRSVIKFETQINDKEIELQINFKQEAYPVVADPDTIERVITNLLDNAIKFTPIGGIICVNTYKKEEGVICISVEDTGSGIEKEDISFIWERFYKTDKSRSKDKVGTGLGLAIVKNIIQKHEQNIWVESELNKGSKFTFTLLGYEG